MNGIDRKTIHNYLDAKCVPHALGGFSLLADAVQYVVENRDDFCMMELYSFVGEKHKKPQKNAERCIRHAISRSTSPCKNSEFICRAADELLMQQEGAI